MSKYLNLKPVEFDKLSGKVQAKFNWMGRLLLPKYDGCFAIVMFLNGVGLKVISRTGEVVKSMDHVYEDILLRYPGISKSKGGIAFLGEAWNPGKTFAELSGTFRRHSAQPGLGFAVFDMVRWDGDPGHMPRLYSPHSYEKRLELLRDYRHILSNVFPPLPVVCEDQEHAIRYAKNLKAMGGYDGAICSDPNAKYEPGSGLCGSFIKIKPLVSFSLRVVGYEEAVGEKTGRPTGSLVVAFKGTTCKVATGLDEHQQATLQEFVGKIIEVACMDVYPGEDGLMREPRYLGIRDDVTNPDY
jgi:ATP-dependent DNA ligase